jgi:hypothetical protein
MLKLVLKVKIVSGFFNVGVYCILGHFQELERLGDFITKLAEQFVLLFNPAKNIKVNISKFDANFNIRRPVQMT